MGRKIAMIPKQLVVLFFGMKLLVLVVVLIARSQLPLNEPAKTYDFFYKSAKIPVLDSFAAWDGQWYAYLSEHSLTEPLPGIQNAMKYVFYPLFPALNRAVNLVIQEPYISGYLLNTLLSLLGIIIFYHLISIDSDTKSDALPAITLLLISPIAIFFNALYTEPLFFLLSVSVLFLGRKHHFIMANLVAGVSIFSRAQGIVLLLPLFIEWLLHVKTVKQSPKKRILEAATFLIPILCFGAYSAYIQSLSGSATAPLEAMLIFGRLPHHLLNIPFLLYLNVKYFFSMPLHDYNTSKLDFLWIIFVCLIQFVTRKKIRLSYHIFNLCLLCMPLLSGKTTSIIRYTAVSFPLYLMMAKLVTRYPWTKQPLYFASIALMTLFTALYANWYWVS